MLTIRVRAPRPVLLALLLAAAGPAVAADRPNDPMVYLKALQEIAAANGGNRAAMTPGYDRSVQYVADQMRQMGYEVRVEEFRFPFNEERSPPVLLSGSGQTPAPAGEVRGFTYSGGGDVTAPLRAINLGLKDDGSVQTSTSACSPGDFAGFEKGAIALVRRGTCPFFVKVQNAIGAGAAAVIAMNEGTPGQTDSFVASLGRPTPIPVVGVGYAYGRTLADLAAKPEEAKVRLKADILTETRSSHSVVAEMRADPGDGRPVVVVGAHLDSVRDGPGINDNGSGVSALLLAASRIAETAAGGSVRVRFGFWGAEEIGLIGAREYVNALSEEERKRIALYINLDMVGSRNYGRYVLADADASGPGAVGAQAMLDSLAARAVPHERRPLGPLGTFSTDMAPFKQRGIQAIGLYTGSAEPKTEALVTRYGGQTGQPHDVCYHRACDTLENVDVAVIEEMAGALTEALRAVAGTKR